MFMLGVQLMGVRADLTTTPFVTDLSLCQHYLDPQCLSESVLNFRNQTTGAQTGSSSPETAQGQSLTLLSPFLQNALT